MFNKEILKSKIDLKNPGPAMEYLDSTMSSKEIYDYLENYIKNAENEIVYLPIILKCIIFMHIIELECDMPYAINADEKLINEFIPSSKYQTSSIKLYNFYNKIIKKYNKKNKFYTYAGFIFDHKYEYSIIPKDYCIILAEIDNNEKVNYSMECVKEFDKIPTIKIFDKEV